MSQAYIVSVLFLLGLIIGSFLNVVIFRIGTGLSIAKGRSKCFSCDKTLSWYELLPVASFIAQKGRCRNCAVKLSWQYPLVEILTGLALPTAYLYAPTFFTPFVTAVAFALIAVLFCLYIVMGVYDLRLKIIPDSLSYTAAIVALLSVGLQAYVYGAIDYYQLAAGPILFLFFAFFWAVSKGKWMGLGDAKLALSVGWVLGLSAGITAILFAFWIGAAYSLLVMLLQKVGVIRGSLGMKSELPLGPFIILGFALVFLFQIDFAWVLSVLSVGAV